MIRRRRRFYETIQKQILVWAGTVRLPIGYDGENIHVPPREEIARNAKENPGSPYKYDSALSPAGHYIPGTLEVTDRFRRTPEGGQEKVFDVALFCAYLERDRQDLIGQGLEIVTDVNDCQAAMDECIPRWEENQDDRARRVIVDELERRRKLEEKGNPVLAGSSEKDVIWAFEHQRRRGAQARPSITTEDLKRVMLGEPPAVSAQAESNMKDDELPPSATMYLPQGRPPAVSTEELTGGKRPAAQPPAPSPATKPDPPAPPAAPGAVNVMQLQRTAKALGLKLVKKEMEGLLDGDKDTIELVAEKIKVAREEQETAAPA